VFLTLFAVYMASGKTSVTGDTLPMRYLPLSLLQERNFDLDEFPFLYTPSGTHYVGLPADHRFNPLRGGDLNVPYYLEHVGGHYLSGYPVAAALLVLPIYVPSILGGVVAESPIFEIVEKICAAAIVALSAVVLYLALAMRTTPRISLVLALIYGLGTSCLSVSSQGMWQHGPSQLALSTALWFVVRAERQATKGWYAILGLALASAIVLRPMNILVVVAIALYVAFRSPKALPYMAVGALPPVLFQIGYNVAYFGGPLHSQLGSTRGFWTTPVLTGLAGVLFSPARGLFVYSPVLLFSGAALILSWRRQGEPLLRYLGIAVAVTMLVYGKWFMWWGGYSFGPRLLADVTPLLAFSLYPIMGVVLRRRALMKFFVATILWAVAAHGVGAVFEESGWNFRVDIDHFPERAWWWLDSPLAHVPERAIKVIARLL